MPHSRTYYLRNPITTVVIKLKSRREAKGYTDYGWTKATEAEFNAYATAKAERVVMRMKPKYVSGLPSRTH